MRAALEDVGIKLDRLRIVLNGFFKLFLAEISRTQVVVVRGSIIPQSYRLLVVLDRSAVVTLGVKNYAEIVVSVSMFMIGPDGVFETLPGFFVALRQELADPDFVEHGRARRRRFQSGSVVVDCLEIVLLPPSPGAPGFEFLRRRAGRGGIGAVQRRRADFQLLGILSLQWEDEKRKEEKEKGYRGGADPGTYIHPRAAS